LSVDDLGFKLRHVGVAVPSLGPATEALSTIFGYRVISGPFDDPIQKVSVNFLTQSREDSPITSMLAKGGGGAYHLCFETTDIEAAVAHAKNNGCVIVSPPVPAVAFNGRRIAWIYTRSRQLFELVEAPV